MTPSTMPGMMPATKSCPTEVSVTAPYTTMTIEGGMRIPSVPALQITPAAISFE